MGCLAAKQTERSAIGQEQTFAVVRTGQWTFELTDGCQRRLEILLLNKRLGLNERPRSRCEVSAKL